MTAGGSDMARNRRIVVVLYPFQGHINPMLQLATILHSKGFSITIAHPEFNSPDPSTHPNFTFVSIADGLSALNFSPADFTGPLLALNSNCEAPFRQLVDEITKPSREDDLVAAIVYDVFMHFAQKVATQLNLPGVSVRTSAAATLFAYSVVPRADGQGYMSYQDFLSDEDQVPELQSLRFKDVLLSRTQNAPDSVQELRAAVTDAMRNSSAIIVNTVHFLEQGLLGKAQEFFPAPIFPIGPFHKLAPSSSSSLLKEDINCIAWLDEQAPRSVLYVSFGSMAKVDEAELLQIAKGLTLSEQSFLWVVRPGSVHGSDTSRRLLGEFRERVGERGCIVEWAPQGEVLGHGAIGGFWSHCGWNSILESVCEGVPMICRPFFGDQILNSRYVCDVWKVGLELDKEIEGEMVARAIRRLMVDKEGEDIRKRAMEFKEKTELSLRTDGSSCNSLHGMIDHIVVCRSSLSSQKPTMRAFLH